MIEKVIEDWLTSADERSFQLAFVQLLIAEGYEVIDISTHGPGERGKDVISKDGSGKFHVYQMKKVDPPGRFSLKMWRDNQQEILEGIDLKIEHPSVPRNTDHKGWFVVNGHLNNDVIGIIDQMNRQRSPRTLIQKIIAKIWKNPRGNQIHTLVKGQLLPRFITQFNSVLPETPRDLIEFLKLYTTDGTSGLEKEKFSNLIQQFFDKENDAHKSKIKSRRAAARAVLLAEYALTPYRAAENWIAVIDGLVITTALLMHWSEKNHLQRDILNREIEILRDEIFDSFKRINSELLVREDFFEGNRLIDPDFIKLRMTKILGYISAWQLSQHLANKGVPNTATLHYLANDKGFSQLELWGEGVVPQMACIGWIAEIGKLQIFDKVIPEILKHVIARNNHFSKDGLPSPYYDEQQVLETKMGISDHPIAESFEGMSYTIASLVNLNVRRNNRDLLGAGQMWRLISHTQFVETIPEVPADYLLWKMKKGEKRARFSNQSQSWKELVIRASRANEIPEIVKQNSWFAPLFLLVFPHRFCPPFVDFLDEALLPGLRAQKILRILQMKLDQKMHKGEDLRRTGSPP